MSEHILIERKNMAQCFCIINTSKHFNDSFLWSEDDENGDEMYGLIPGSSIYECLEKIEKELKADEYGDDSFEININVALKDGGSFKIQTLQELSDAKLKYAL